MKEFTKHLKFYRVYGHSGLSKLVPENTWGDIELATSFLDKYWLNLSEYKSVWKPIQGYVTRNSGFLENSKEINIDGGRLFTKDQFHKLQKCLLDIGEKEFVIIQIGQKFNSGEPQFRMKFPVNVTWEELIKGNYISAVLFEMPYNEYLVYGKKREWSRYSNNDHIEPFHLLKFDNKHEKYFHKHF